LAQRVLRLLEVEIGDVAPGPLDQVRSLGRVRAELRGRPHQVLRVADLLPLRGGEVLSDRVEPLLREFEGALEVVVLYRRVPARGPGSSASRVRGPRLPCRPRPCSPSRPSRRRPPRGPSRPP